MSRKIFVPAFTLSVLIALAGCQEPEGPAEKAGKELDKAASAVGAQIESAGEQLRDAARN